MFKNFLRFASVNLSLGFTCLAISAAFAKEGGEETNTQVFSATDPAITCDFYASSRMYQNSLQYKGTEFTKSIVSHVEFDPPKISRPDLNLKKALTQIKIDHAKFFLDVELILLSNGKINLSWVAMTSKMTGYVRNSIMSQVLGLLVYPIKRKTSIFMWRV